MDSEARKKSNCNAREDDPHWSNNWIRPEECAHLTNVIMLELNANGLQIVNKNSSARAAPRHSGVSGLAVRAVHLALQFG